MTLKHTFRLNDALIEFLFKYFLMILIQECLIRMLRVFCFAHELKEDDVACLRENKIYDPLIFFNCGIFTFFLVLSFHLSWYWISWSKSLHYSKQILNAFLTICISLSLCKVFDFVLWNFSFTLNCVNN